MPKIKANTISTISKAAIEKELIELESLLEARMDTDNIHTEAGSVTSVGRGSFSDLADFSSPIYADKFFGKNASDVAAYPDHAVDFYEDIFQNLLLKNYDSDTYSILSQKVTITLNYKNQVNLEKPDVVITGTGQSTLEQQQKAREEYYKKRDAEYKEWLARDTSISVWDTLLGMLTGSFAGSIIGFAVGNIPGALIGGIGGAAAGAVASVGAQGGFSTDIYKPGEYDSHAANTQIVLFKHPANYRMVSYTEVVDRLNEVMPSSDPIRYTDDYIKLSRAESDMKPAMSMKLSAESNLDDDFKSYISYTVGPYEVDAETTAVAVTIIPEYPGVDLIEGEDDYITFLGEIDILFKEIA